eukprot:gnl/MRDRNA2_/MRDRNA2_24712_c0_seq1.p1 gnl/MRDRNA2_/MRDRNA2_24712_c0~~gnl/MRDRNA2_/MRDRNA2_24712_c0_seq1.p1  ORF type:complete len:103 (-),score=8.97 gnl/MRDRNA2_/MRDRNA2_24712_c0_seq1:8-316(-)
MEVDTICYNATISVCGVSAQWRQSLLVLGNMCFEDVSINTATYSCVMNACDKGNRWDYALRLLQDFKRWRLRDTICYSIAISTCEKGKHWELSLHLLEESNS